MGEINHTTITISKEHREKLDVIAEAYGYSPRNYLEAKIDEHYVIAQYYLTQDSRVIEDRFEPNTAGDEA